MKNEFEMTLSSPRPLTELSARNQISALCEFDGGLMCPDKVGEFEPIRTPFDPADLSGPVKWLSKPQGGVLYRAGNPIHFSGEIWNRTLPKTSRFPSPRYSNYWTGRFDGKWVERIGVQKLEQFVSEMFRITGSDFGLLTTEVDRKAKNQSATSQSYQGFDLELGIPGLYWINLFSEELAQWLDLAAFPKELATLTRLPGGGWLVKFCESPHRCRDIDVLQKQRAAIEWLGAERFFDIRFPDRKLDPPKLEVHSSEQHQ